MADQEKGEPITRPAPVHNSSPQINVATNPDPALDFRNEHQHAHIHHSNFAKQGRTDDVYYYHEQHLEGDRIASGGNKDSMPGYTGPQQYGLPHKEKADVEVAENQDPSESIEQYTSHNGASIKFRRYSTYRNLIHLAILVVATGWWIASLVLHRNDKNWIIPFLLWLAITLRIIFFHIPITLVSRPMHWTWNNTGVRVNELIPENLRLPAGALLTIAVILIGSFVTPETADNTRANRAVSLLGLVIFIGILYATSRNRKAIKWHTVIVGMLTQFIMALFVLRTTAGHDIFNFISELARELLGFASDGVIFLTDDSVPPLHWFLVTTLPAILFFVAFVSLLYYWGILQWFIGKFAVFFFWSMRVSGAEAVVAAASPFIGQGESAMLIKPFVAHLTLCELHQVMCSGFATISGSALIAYLSLGINPIALISSCVMSIPASLAISKLRWPEEEETLTAGRVVIPEDEDEKSANALHAFAKGAWLGLKIMGMIAATLLCIIALVALIDGLLTWWGRYLNIDNLTLELILGYIFYPVSFLLGVSREGDDILKVGQLLGIKVVENEFVAFTQLQKSAEYANLSPRSRLIATYALCSFGNIGSLGTQIGVLSQISPARSGDVSRIAVSALAAGVISTLTSASIAGLLVTDQKAFYTATTT